MDAACQKPRTHGGDRDGQQDGAKGDIREKAVPNSVEFCIRRTDHLGRWEVRSP